MSFVIKMSLKLTSSRTALFLSCSFSLFSFRYYNKLCRNGFTSENLSFSCYLNGVASGTIPCCRSFNQIFISILRHLIKSREKFFDPFILIVSKFINYFMELLSFWSILLFWTVNHLTIGPIWIPKKSYN